MKKILTVLFATFVFSSVYALGANSTPGTVGTGSNMGTSTGTGLNNNTNPNTGINTNTNLNNPGGTSTTPPLGTPTGTNKY